MDSMTLVFGDVVCSEQSLKVCSGSPYDHEFRKIIDEFWTSSPLHNQIRHHPYHLHRCYSYVGQLSNMSGAAGLPPI